MPYKNHIPYNTKRKEMQKKIEEKRKREQAYKEIINELRIKNPMKYEQMVAVARDALNTSKSKLGSKQNILNAEIKIVEADTLQKIKVAEKAFQRAQTSNEKKRIVAWLYNHYVNLTRLENRVKDDDAKKTVQKLVKSMESELREMDKQYFDEFKEHLIK